jgi:hypothetical protein
METLEWIRSDIPDLILVIDFGHIIAASGIQGFRPGAKGDNGWVERDRSHNIQA